MVITKRFLLYSWLIFFAYSLIVGLLVQKIILPLVFPKAHWGEGLSVGGDWISFYQNAIEVAEKVRKYGWEHWELRPSIDGQIMTGITAFFFALTGIHKPYILLPYNAFLHATAGILLILLLTEFNIKPKVAFVSASLFIIFPSSLTWVSQIHRDGLYCLGFLFLFYSLLLLLKDKTKLIFLSIPSGILGLLLIYLARQHMIIPLRWKFIHEYFAGKPGNLDTHFVPQKPSDYILYAPRALQIGLFAPFPNMWFSKGGTSLGTIARYITPFETIIIWIGLLLFLIFLIEHKSDPRIYLILALSLLFIYLHVITEPNMGPIYRKRYVFIMTLICLGYANFLQKFLYKHEKA